MTAALIVSVLVYLASKTMLFPPANVPLKSGWAFAINLPLKVPFLWFFSKTRKGSGVFSILAIPVSLYFLQASSIECSKNLPIALFLVFLYIVFSFSSFFPICSSFPVYNFVRNLCITFAIQSCVILGICSSL